MKPVQIIASITLAATATGMVDAQAQPAGHKAVDPAATASPAARSLTSAEVLKVYPKEKKVLLKHGPIPNIGMGAMTMEFDVTDAKMLSSVKAGDKVRIAADQIKGEYVVTHIEKAK